MDGQVVEWIRREFTEAVLVVLTTFDTDDDIDRALLAGAKGYLLEDVAPGDLVACVGTVHGGGTWVSPMAVAAIMLVPSLLLLFGLFLRGRLDAAERSP